MKIAIICSILSLLCGNEPALAQKQVEIADESDSTFAPYNHESCSDSGAMSTGDFQYKAIDAGNGRCKWVVDEDAMKVLYKIQQDKKDLYWALRTRPLTDAEMVEVEQEGIMLITPTGVPYNEAEKERELNDALLQQYKIRAIANQKHAK
jgi:hypothetical protein